MGGGAKGEEVRALKAARPRQGEEQVKARSRVTDIKLQSTLLTLRVMLGPVDRCVIFRVIQCFSATASFWSPRSFLRE